MIESGELSWLAIGVICFMGFAIICCIAGFFRWIFRINRIVYLLEQILTETKGGK